jgi:RNA polymerase sigma-70 factor (ECF subfamily)
MLERTPMPQDDALDPSVGSAEQPPPPAGVSAPQDALKDARTARVTALVQANFDYVWRVVRRFGVPESVTDDAVQQVFIVLTRRIEDVAEGTERAFLFRTALHVAGDAVRTRARSREAANDAIDAMPDAAPTPEDTVARRRAVASLQEILQGMDEGERAVFVLFELEGLLVREIAEIVELPEGTVASRLRRAREYFHGAVKRLRAREGRHT